MDAQSSAAAAQKAAGNSPSATNALSAAQSKPAPGSGFGFPKDRRLLKRPEFRRVYDHGTRLTSPSFTVFRFRRDDASGPRAGFTTPRALGKAVIRNRIRRRMREAVRLELPLLTAPVDLVFHPRRSILEVDFARLRAEVARVFDKCNAS